MTNPDTIYYDEMDSPVGTPFQLEVWHELGRIP